jgi:predicted site-specific integrase-resolvase
MSPLSTFEVAKRFKINKATLERWLANGKVGAPKRLRVGRKFFRNWTQLDIERIRKYKQQNYRKGRGRKAKPKR